MPSNRRDINVNFSKKVISFINEVDNYYFYIVFMFLSFYVFHGV